VTLVSAALPKGAVGEYQLQAAVAAVHDEAGTADETDWPQILAPYGLLEQMTGNPMVTLNRAVAAAMVDGRRVASRCSKASTSAWPATTASTPCARTCWRWTATGKRRSRIPLGGRANDERGRAELPADARGMSDG
jgi:hypothetical protein